MNRHLTEDELALHYYGEMTDEAEATALAHLDGCASCRAALARLQRVMALLPTEDPPADARLESRVWQRLEQELKPAAHHRQPATHAAGRLLPAARFAWAAAAAVLVLAAFVAGRVSSGSTAPAVTTAPAVAPATPRDRVLTVDLAEHLERAELALTDFLVQGEDAPVPATEDLIAANRLYRNTASALGEEQVASVLDELERALIEIGATDADAAERAVVRESIDTGDLLFRMRVIRAARDTTL
jgi:hypothetical protein